MFANLFIMEESMKEEKRREEEWEEKGEGER
jgi:hypothetical protein